METNIVLGILFIICLYGSICTYKQPKTPVNIIGGYSFPEPDHEDWTFVKDTGGFKMYTDDITRPVIEVIPVIQEKSDARLIVDETEVFNGKKVWYLWKSIADSFVDRELQRYEEERYNALRKIPMYVLSVKGN